MAVAYLIYGFVGSGKTTLALSLEQKGAVRLSIDDWTIAATGDDVHLEPAVFDRYWRLLMKLWPAIVARGVDVALDFGFWTRAQRDEVRAFAASVGAEARLVWVRCPERVARQRCAQRTHERGGGYLIDDAAFDWLKQKFQPLDPDEVYTIVTTG